MKVSVLIPTTGRRQETLDRVRSEFLRQDDELEILTVEGFTCGGGWNHLAGQASGDYWLFTADDALPHPGWFDAARVYVDAGKQPVARFYEVDGRPTHPLFDTTPDKAAMTWSRFFLLTPAVYEEVGPFLDLSWWLDLDYSSRLIAAGYQLHACERFAFTHLDEPRDWQTPELNIAERRVYDAARYARGV